MSLFNRGLVAAMEDETGGENTELAIDDAGAESMEADLVEAVDLAADIDSGTNEIEQTIKDADQLERHVEVLTDAEGEGGAAPEVVEATEIAVEAIYSRLGIHTGTGIPALESFSTKAGRAKNTTVAVEALSENIKRIWEAVKMAFKKLVNYVKDFFAKLFDANKKMLGRVNSLRAKAKAIKGTPGEKISASGITNVIGGADAASVKAGIAASAVSPALKTAAEGADSLKEFIAGVGDKAAFDGVEWSAGNDKTTNLGAPEGMAWYTAATFGANEIVYLCPKATAKGEAAYEAAAKYSVKVNKGEAKGEAEVAPLSQADINSILDAVEGRVKELLGQNTAVSQIQQKLDTAVAEINKAASQASEEDKEVGARSTKARSAVTATANGSIKLVTLAGSETTRGLQACLTLVERSIASYKEAPAEKK